MTTCRYIRNDAVLDEIASLLASKTVRNLELRHSS